MPEPMTLDLLDSLEIVNDDVTAVVSMRFMTKTVRESLSFVIRDKYVALVRVQHSYLFGSAGAAPQFVRGHPFTACCVLI